MLFAILVVIFGVLACARCVAQPDGKPRALRAVVTVAPLRGLIEPLLPAGSTVTVLMPPGRSEHGYEFTAKDLDHLAHADLVFYVGLGLEPRLDTELKKQRAPRRVEVCFATAVGIKDKPHEDHDGEPDHDHQRSQAEDQHLWLDPGLVSQVIPHLGKSVQKAMDTGKQPTTEPDADLKKRLEDLSARVAKVDENYRTRLAPLKGHAIVTHHNAFPRLAARYGLRVAAVIRGLENAEPSAAGIEEVVKAIRKEQVPTIFVEPQYNASLAERVAKEAGAKVARIDPIGDGDWFKLMESNLDSLVNGLSAK